MKDLDEGQDKPKRIQSKKETLKILRKRRGLAFDCEKWIPFKDPVTRKITDGVRRDFAGIADVVFYGDDGSTLFIQCCTTDAEQHRRKLLGDWHEYAKGKFADNEERARKAARRTLDNVCRFLRQGRKIEVWSFRRTNLRRPGAPKKVALRVVEVTLEDAVEAARLPGELPLSAPIPLAVPTPPELDLSKRQN